MTETIELLHQTIELLKRANDRIDQLEQQIQRMMPTPQSEWLDKHAAAEIVHRSHYTLSDWRKDSRQGLIEGLHWQHDGHQIMWNREMLAHWYANRATPEIHAALVQQRGIERQIAKKRGRPRKALRA